MLPPPTYLMLSVMEPETFFVDDEMCPFHAHICPIFSSLSVAGRGSAYINWLRDGVCNQSTNRNSCPMLLSVYNIIFNVTYYLAYVKIVHACILDI
jgi:hypothetical protein